jgi:hypothetical protein
LLFPIYLLFGCVDSVGTHQPRPLSVLDYAILRAEDGWRLRIHGDGSGTLTHRQYPHHHLDYPARTFELHKLLRTERSCDTVRPATGCYELETYRARGDREYHCGCSGAKATREAMTVAIAQMQTAVDDVPSERACRMLRRAWLAAR